MDPRSEAIAAAVLLLSQASHPDVPLPRCVEVEHTLPEPSVRAALMNTGEMCRNLGTLHPGPWVLSDYRGMPGNGPYRTWNCAARPLETDPPAMGGVRNEVGYSVEGSAETARNVTVYVKVANAYAKDDARIAAVLAVTEAARRVNVSLTAEEIGFLRELPPRGIPNARTERGVHIAFGNYLQGLYVVQFTAPYVLKAC